MVILLLVASVAFAQQALHVRVGGLADTGIGWPPVITVCDDPSIAVIEAGDAHLFVRGRRAGRTRCGLWRSARFPPVTIDICVDDAP